MDTSGLSLGARGWRFPPATMNAGPDHFHGKIEENKNALKARLEIR